VRSWELTVALDPGGDEPLFLQLSRALQQDIRSGRLPPGSRLPGSRTLADELGIHRNTVLAGYSELISQGWLHTHPAAGTFVARDLPPPPTSVAPERIRARSRLGPGFPLGPPIPPTTRVPDFPPGVLVLAKGAPDVRRMPAAELSRAYRRALARHGQALLGYGDPRGHPRLRRALAEMLTTTRALPACEDTVFITRGSQMALDLIARALLRPGDVVAVEGIGHPAAWAALRLTGATLAPVPIDAQGIDVTALAALAERQPLRAVYLTPHHQFPTTSVLPAARRMAVLDLARRHRLLVVEDDYDHEFHYDGRPVLPLASRDEAGVVVYVGTLSKVLAPGLRIGYLVAPRAVIDRVRELRIATDLQGDQAHECAVAELFEDGDLVRHVRRMRRLYRTRRDALVASLERNLGSALSLTRPAGGMALWARVDPGIDLERWSKAGLEQGVAFVPGRRYAFDDGPVQAVRLGFAPLDESELEEAARRMALALRKSLPRVAPASAAV
jgi:GntR family transcriptional regulator / MocR family aminotransferase